jgi:HEPN domain-containing protein
MKAITREWISKAENDFSSATLLLSQKNPNFDLICFLSQQCVEKYLKGCLQEADIYFPRTHELTVLLDLMLATEASWESMRLKLKALTAYAVEFRYPGVSATESLAQQAVQNCTEVRQVILEHLKQTESDGSQGAVTD